MECSKNDDFIYVKNYYSGLICAAHSGRLILDAQGGTILLK